MKKPLSVKIAFVVRISVWLADIIIFFFGATWIRSEVGSCFWRDNFGFLCPGCGGTRAVSYTHLGHRMLQPGTLALRCIKCQLPLVSSFSPSIDTETHYCLV